MQSLSKSIASVTVLVGLLASASAFGACPLQRADVAAPKLGPDCNTKASFINTHNTFVSVAKKNEAEVVFLGDSITAHWSKRYGQHFQDEFGKYKAVNFGIGADRTQHVLWRVQNGEFDGFTPKAVVLMIGTNNTRKNPPSEVASGIRNIVAAIHNASPDTTVLLHAIFPRGSAAANQHNAEVNREIAGLHDGRGVHFVNINDRLLTDNGSISRQQMPDFLHLSASGYRVWADGIRATLSSIVQ